MCVLASSVILVAAASTASSAFALPEGRHYEMVSPPYKNGYGVYGFSGGAIEAVAPNGDSVAFVSSGSFAGAGVDNLKGSYLARRGGTGWATRSFEPPASVAPEGSAVDFSPSLTSTLWMGSLGPNTGAAFSESPENTFLTGGADPASGWQVAGEVLQATDGRHHEPLDYKDASPDFCHILFRSQAGGDLLPVSEGTQAELYDLSTGCEGEPVLRLVGLNNQGKVLDPYCSESLGGELTRPLVRPQFNAVASSGREIVFTTFVNPAARSDGCLPEDSAVPTNPAQVFVRLDGSRTLEVSRPLTAGAFGGCGEGGKAGETPGEVPCAGAAGRAPSLFWGASEDGSKVLFTTKQPLVPGDGDVSDNLYLATIGCPSASAEPCEVAQKQLTGLARVSTALASGEAAEVQGVVKIAPDASRVYFVARGRLSEAPGVEGRVAVRGADNLYVYDTRSAGLGFIADLCSGPARSGAVEDARCPTDLHAEGKSEGDEEGERNDGRLLLPLAEAQVAGGGEDPGRFLVFASYARLLRTDTDDAKDVYRYDAVTGVLDRVSLGEAGYGANGNCNDGASGTACDARAVPAVVLGNGDDVLSVQREMGDRAISEDGSRIVFRTAGRLSADASNGLVNVYEWHKEPESGEGRVSLVSGGTSQTADADPVITPSGSDIFFTTSQGLVPQDTDGQADVYDARLGEGFPSPPADPQPCASDACQGPLTNPAALLVPGSVSQAPGGNFAPPAPATAVKPSKPKPKSKHKRRKRNGKASRHALTAARPAGRGGR